MAPITELPVEILLEVAAQSECLSDAAALMRTCGSFHKKLSPELHKDMPVLELERLTGFPMSLEYMENHGSHARNLALHYNPFGEDSPYRARRTDPRQQLLGNILKGLLRIYNNKESLETFGFTLHTVFPESWWPNVAQFLGTHITPRIVVLPGTEFPGKWQWAHSKEFSEDFTEALIDAHIRVRRGKPTTNGEDRHGSAQTNRERPGVTKTKVQRKHLDVYFAKTSDLHAVNMAMNEPDSIVEEITIFGNNYMNYDAPQEQWQLICQRIGLKVEDLSGIALHRCSLGHGSPFSRLKITARLRRFAVINSDAPRHRSLVPDIVNALQNLVALHANSTEPPMDEFSYRQNIRQGRIHRNRNESVQPIPDEILKHYIQSSPLWRVLCIQQNAPCSGTIKDFACDSLEYCCLRFAHQEPTHEEFAEFACGASKIHFFGANYNIFTRVYDERNREPRGYGEKIEQLAHALLPMGNLRHLCLFSPEPVRGVESKLQRELDRAVRKLTATFETAGHKLNYVHIVMRNIDYNVHQWPHVPRAFSYAIERSRGKARTIRKTELPANVREDLETMGAGKRLDMADLVQDTMEHLHITEDDLRKRDEGRTARERERMEIEHDKLEREELEEENDAEPDQETLERDEPENKKDAAAELYDEFKKSVMESHPETVAGSKRSGTSEGYVPPVGNRQSKRLKRKAVREL